MRTLNARELEIVSNQKMDPKPILDIPGEIAPITDMVENWIILMPSNVREGIIKTIGRMLESTHKITPIDLRVMGELRDAQNLYFLQKGDYFQREISDVNELLSYLQIGYTAGGELLNSITPPQGATCIQLLKYALDSPQHAFEWMEYESRFNDYYIRFKQDNDLVDTDAKILKAWMKVFGAYSKTTYVPSTLMTTSQPTIKSEPSNPKYANNPSPYKYNVASSIEKQKIRDIIIQVARSKGYPENRLLAHAWYESRYDPDARNPKSTAAGLGQFLKGTGHSYGLDPWPEGFFDPKRNAEAMVNYVSILMKQAIKYGASSEEDSWKFALGGYYEGTGFLIRDLIRLNYVQGQGMKFISKIRNFSWNELEPNLTGTYAIETQKYVQTVAKLATNPP